MKFLRALFWMNLAVVGMIGGVHVSYTFDNFHELSQEALYFAGTGLGVVILVLFNFAVWYAPGLDPLPRRLAHAANIIMMIYGIFAIKAVPEPQAYVGFGALIFLAIASLLMDRANRGARAVRMEVSVSLNVRKLKVYVPAKDFELSKRFYLALGFTMSPAWGDAVDFELGGHQFRLQDYYVKDWADNCMMLLDVDSVEAWHRHAEEAIGSSAFPSARIKPPDPVDGSLVFHVWDPSGVLLVFAQ